MALIFSWPGIGSSHELTRTDQGAVVHWAEGPIDYDYVFSSSVAELGGATRRAFDTWAQVLPEPLRPRFTGEGGTPLVPSDGRNTVELVSAWELGQSSRIVAWTALQYDVATGTITEGDILLNGESFRFSDQNPGAMDTESVVLHEAGHLLGLAHSCGESGGGFPSCFSVPEADRDRVLLAVMAPTLGPGEVRPALTEDERAGLAEIYEEVPDGLPQRPEPNALVLECGESAILTGQNFVVHFEVAVRDDRGVIRPIAATRFDSRTLQIARAADLQGGIDVIVFDRTHDSYGSFPLSRTEIRECGGPEPQPPFDEEDGGCRCVAGTQTKGGAQWAGVLGFALLASVLRRKRWAALALVALLALPGPVFAYECSRVDVSSGPSLFWNRRVIQVWIDQALSSDPETVGFARDEIERSFATWSEVDCSDLSLPVMGLKAAKAGYHQQGSNENVVTFVDADDNGGEGWPYQRAVIAVTTNTFDSRTGEVFDADIELNEQYFDFRRVTPECITTTGVMDLRNTVTHEIGHVIGLDHPPSSQKYEETTMFASAPPCETQKRDLAPDDIQGICSIYPAGEAVQQCFLPDAVRFSVVDQDDGYGCRHIGTRSSASPWLALLALLSVPAAFRRSRRSS